MSNSSEGGEVGDVRANLVFKNGQTNPFYRLGLGPCADTGETTQFIAIAELGGRIICALPGPLEA